MNHQAYIKHQPSRNWVPRLWSEIEKFCFSRLSVSRERISSRPRGVCVIQEWTLQFGGLHMHNDLLCTERAQGTLSAGPRAAQGFLGSWIFGFSDFHICDFRDYFLLRNMFGNYGGELKQKMVFWIDPGPNGWC